VVLRIVSSDSGIIVGSNGIVGMVKMTDSESGDMGLVVIIISSRSAVNAVVLGFVFFFFFGDFDVFLDGEDVTGLAAQP
jgi:hypothetical protein